DSGFLYYSNESSITYQGTVTRLLPDLTYSTGNYLTGFVQYPLPVTIVCTFKGTQDGIRGINNNTYDVIASDLELDGATSTNIAVIPYLFARNIALIGADNITRDQASLLLVSSGTNSGQLFHGMAATYLGGYDQSPMFLIGSDPDSGTRANIEKV